MSSLGRILEKRLEKAKLSLVEKICRNCEYWHGMKRKCKLPKHSPLSGMEEGCREFNYPKSLKIVLGLEED